MASSIPPEPTGSESPGSDSDPTEPISSVDALPPVEPPSAKFIIQLFVIPAVIVAAVVLLWLLINWLANPGQQDPEAIIHGLRSSSQTRFQQAEELAGMLRMEQSYPELKTSRRLAAGLGKLLGEQVAEAQSEPDEDRESAIRMRMFLCASLGEFHVVEPLPWLLNAARNDPNGHVRRRAIGATAVLAGWFAEQDPPQSLSDPDLIAILSEMADSEDALDRSAAAFALGVFAAGPDADPQMRELLAELVGDFYFDARYNAATALARIGDLRSVPALAEMLDLDQIAASIESEVAVNPKLPGARPPEEVVSRLRADKRDKLIKNALVGVDFLLNHYAPTDLPQLTKALKDLNARAAEVRDPGPIPKTLQSAVQQMAERFE